MWLIEYNTKVVGIAIKKDKVITNSIHNGKEKKEEFDYAIYAIPAPCVTRIEFDHVISSKSISCTYGDWLDDTNLIASSTTVALVSRSSFME
jgi:hypothetical protein